jgi:ABC-type transporter Mla maintaining outer membrane lipid asymmetry permease subunit MlaE
VLALRRIIDFLRGQPSAILSGALAGGSVAGLMGVAVWAFVGIFNSTVTGNATPMVRQAWAMLPDAALGGAISGFVAGALLAAVGMKLLGDIDENAGPGVPGRR